MEMVEIKVSELTGAALDWAVAECEGHKPPLLRVLRGNVALPQEGDTMWCDYLEYSVDWAQGGPIKEREGIATHKYRMQGMPDEPPRWAAAYSADFAPPDSRWESGTTELEATMRCYVLNKQKGDTVMVPAELIHPHLLA